jgi:hypothetical protein
MGKNHLRKRTLSYSTESFIGTFCSGPVFDLIYHGLRKVSQLQTLLRSIEVECMPQTFSLSMEVVSYLHLPYLQDIPRFDGRYKAEEVQPLVY